MFKDESPKSLTPTLSLIRDRGLSLFSLSRIRERAG
jgi:hypothetical protein